MQDETDQTIEQLIRDGWAANGLSSDDLPQSDDARMLGLIAIMRSGWGRAEAEIDRLRRREREIELRLADLEERVRQVEEKIGLGYTLQ
jgi:hypothetical protein